MAEGDNDDHTENTEEDGSDNLTKLQDEFKRIGAREKNRGTNQGRREVLTALGFEGKSIDEALAEVNAMRARDGDQTDLERRFQEASTKLAEVERKLSLAQLQGDIALALAAEGVKGDRTQTALRLVAADLSELPSLPTHDEVVAAVQEFKTTVPELFPSTETTTTTGAGTIPRITDAGDGTATNRGGTDDAVERGRKMVDRLFHKELAARSGN